MATLSLAWRFKIHVLPVFEIGGLIRLLGPLEIPTLDRSPSPHVPTRKLRSLRDFVKVKVV